MEDVLNEDAYLADVAGEGLGGWSWRLLFVAFVAAVMVVDTDGCCTFFGAWFGVF